MFNNALNKLKAHSMNWLGLVCFSLIVQCSFARQVIKQGSLIDSTQSSRSCKGQVMTKTNVPLAGAVVTLSGLDTTYVKASLSNREGNFLFTVPKWGKYSILISHIGRTSFQQTIVITDSTTNIVQKFYLDEASTNLKEVVVKEKPLLFDVRTDRIVINVEGNSVLSSGNALDVLEKAPRVNVDQTTRTLSIDGQPGLVLFQDGSQVYRTPSEIVNYLHTLPANSISRIEVLTQASSRYDAAGGGVILIYTNHKNDEGISGDANLTGAYGLYPKTNGSLAFTLNKSKLHTSFLYTGLYQPTYFKYTSRQMLLGKDGVSQGYSTSDQFRRVLTNHHSFRLAVDWKASSNSTFGIILLGSKTLENITPFSSIAFKLPGPNQVLQEYTSISNFDSKFRNGTTNLNWRQKIKSNTSTLSADIDFAYYQNNARSGSSITPLNQVDRLSETFSILLPLDAKIIAAKTDYQGTIAGNGNWEMGLKYSSVNVNTVPSVDYYTQTFTNLIPALLRPFSYKENTSAGYISNSIKWKKWAINAGFRLEHTHYQGISNDTIFSNRVYTNIFPQLSFSRTGADNNQWNFSYNRRIVRPNFEALSPAFVFFDPITLGRGNPLLVPQLTSTIQASYINKQRHSLTLLYNQTKNRIAQVLYRSDSSSATIINTSINFDQEQRLAIILSLPIKLTSIWQFQATATGSHSRFYSTFRNEITIVSQSTGLFQLNNTIKLNKWTADALLIYRTTAAIGFLRYQPYFTMNIGLQRPILGNKGSVKLAVTDLFNTFFSGNYGQYLNTDIAFHHTRESRQIMLTVTYGFGNRSVKNMTKRGMGSESEQDRIRRDY